MKNGLYKYEDTILRVMDVKDDMALVMDCQKRHMPIWQNIDRFASLQGASESDLYALTGISPVPEEELSAKERQFVNEHFTMIAGILPAVGDIKERSFRINGMAAHYNVTTQTLRFYLCLYLAFYDKTVFAPAKRKKEKVLSTDEKNIRWALNKFYYTRKNHSLKSTYILMLKEKYCDAEGNLVKSYPSFYQFRYFYRKTKNWSNYYIARKGLTFYQRNKRPLLGDHVQEFAPHVGIGMLDATICDIYLVNEEGRLIGRPVLTACIDAYSSLCCGYLLSWEGGVYSLRGLMRNLVEDKVKLCKKFGIPIEKEDWNVSALPGMLVTDMGREYLSDNFSQITELGVTLTNLDAYRPELKGPVEKFFDLIQGYFKSLLKGKGVIEPDFQERGVHDYRKDACLTMDAFEKIILHCIVYYNTKRILENYPYTEEMLKDKVRPNAAAVFNYGLAMPEASLLPVSKERLMLTLLPRTMAKFTRTGLKVNGMRYKNENYREAYLNGKEVTVAYNPDDVSSVWLIEDNAYTPFELIESRFTGKSIADAQAMDKQQKSLVKAAGEENTQARIDLMRQIQTIVDTSAVNTGDTHIKQVRHVRKKEQAKRHKDFNKEVHDDN